jgi:hypothetical protein
MNTNRNRRKKTALIQWFITRLLCLTHLIISIFLLLGTKFAHHLFFLPIIGVGLIVLEIIIFILLKFRLHCTFFLLLTYSIFILSTIWLLELYRIKYLISMRDQQASVEVFSVIYYAPSKIDNDFLLYHKYLWSQIQIQVFIFVIVILKGLCETKNHKLQIVIQTWTAALDILDFIDLLSYPILYSDNRFVYITLSVWSISCLQFIIQVDSIKKIFIKRNYYRLGSIITYSFISMLITDFPYLILRLYSIFGVQNRDYTSYFLVFKNIFIIILQTADVWTAFKETTRKKRNASFV